MIESYPLYWPEGQEKTWKYGREHSRFKSTFAVARDQLLEEIDRLIDAKYSFNDSEVVLSTNIPLRRDGLPYANTKEPEDPGVAVYFKYKQQDMCFACDRYQKVWENMVAIRKTIEAFRGIERWGSSEMLQRAFRGFIAVEHSQPSQWHDVLGVPRNCSKEVAKAAYRRLIQKHHPDRSGGNHEKFLEIQKAWADYEQEARAWAN